MISGVPVEDPFSLRTSTPFDSQSELSRSRTDGEQRLALDKRNHPPFLIVVSSSPSIQANPVALVPVLTR